MFTVEERERVHDRVLRMAEDDPRVVAGAEVGSLAQGGGDQWSDLDLTFGVADDVAVVRALDDWTTPLRAELDAVRLFDLPADSTIYRVFLLPGGLQLDVSFTPARDFGARGPKFRLLFGTATERPHFPQPSPEETFGLGVHHALRARFCIERGRAWQAEHWISAARDQALALACLRRGLDAGYGRGFDDLAVDVLKRSEDALVRSSEREELLRALSAAYGLLLAESADVADTAQKVTNHLGDLTAPTLP